MSRRVTTVLVVLVGVLALTVSPVGAITHGTFDGDEHPQVGSLVVDVPGIGAFQWCTGTLVEPATDRSVVVTATHCFAGVLDVQDLFPGTTVAVTFDPTIDFDNGIFYTGEMIMNPQFGRNMADLADAGVFLLDEHPPITPARLPTEGLLDRLFREKTLKHTMFTAVGYGSTRDTIRGGFDAIDPGNLDRNSGDQAFLSLTKAWITLSMVNNAGQSNAGTCYGDSGGPHFVHIDGVETDIVASITVTGDSQCKATDKTYRLDTPAARDFLAPYVVLP